MPEILQFRESATNQTSMVASINAGAASYTLVEVSREELVLSSAVAADGHMPIRDPADIPFQESNGEPATLAMLAASFSRRIPSPPDSDEIFALPDDF